MKHLENLQMFLVQIKNIFVEKKIFSHFLLVSPSVFSLLLLCKLFDLNTLRRFDTIAVRIVLRTFS